MFYNFEQFLFLELDSILNKNVLTWFFNAVVGAVDFTRLQAYIFSPLTLTSHL